MGLFDSLAGAAARAISSYIPAPPSGGYSPPSSSSYPKPQNAPVPPMKASTTYAPSYGVPQNSSVPPPPQPARWNENAPYQDRLAHFKDPNNLRDAQAELLSVKGIYGDRAGAGNLGGAWAANDWAKQVRSAAGIPESDYYYGNGPAPEVNGAAAGGQQPGFYYPPPPGPQVPVYTPAIPVRDSAMVGKYVDNQMAANLVRSRSQGDQAIAAGRNTANQQLGSLGTQFTRLKTQIGEDRGVENVQNQRNLSPYSGRSDATLAEIERQRGISDRQMNEDQMNRIANVNSDLAQLENGINAKYAALQETQGAERERLIREIESDERQYDMAIHGIGREDIMANSSLTSQEFQKSLQAFNANRAAFDSNRNFGLQAGQLTGNYNGQRTLQGQQVDRQNKQDHIDLANFLTQQFGKPVTPTDDPMLSYAQVAGIPTVAAQKMAVDAQQSSFDNAIKKALAENTISKSQADMMQGAQRLSIQRQNANTAAGNAKNSQAARDIESEVYNHAQDFTSPQDVTDWFNANSSYLAKNLGASQVEALKKSFMAPFSGNNSNYTRALSLAQKDDRWKDEGTDRKALIQEYEALLSSPN